LINFFIEENKYVAGEYPLAEKLIIPFWDRVVNLMPMWLAPNLITLAGLMSLGGA